jgi:hypothetical protein
MVWLVKDSKHKNTLVINESSVITDKKSNSQCASYHIFVLLREEKNLSSIF